MKKQSFLKGSAVLLGMVLVTKIIGMFYKIPLTGLLGGTGMSCYSAAFAVFTPVFAIAAAGIPSAMSRLISEQMILERYKNAVKIRKTAQLIFSLSAVILSACLIASAKFFSVRVIDNEQAKIAITAVAFSLPFAALMNVLRGWAEGNGSMTTTALSEIAETIGKLIFGLSGAYIVTLYAKDSFLKYHGCFGHYCTDLHEALLTAAPFSAAAAALGVSLASAAACIFTLIGINKMSAQLSREYVTSPPCTISFAAAASKLVKYSLPASLMACTATLSGMADLISVPACLSKAMEKDKNLFMQLSAYGVDLNDRAAFVYGSYTGLALTIFGLVPTFTAMLGKSVMPSLTASYSQGKTAESRKHVMSVLFLSSAISLPSGLGICFLSRPLLKLFFFGSLAEISVCVKPLAILGLAVIFMGTSLPCMSALQACGKQTSALLITLLGTAIKLALNILLIEMPKFNICGAAVSAAVSQAIVCILATVVLIRSSKAGLSSIKAILIPILPSALCTAAAVLTQRTFIMHTEILGERLGVIISVAIGAIICIISYSLLCILPKNQIKSLFLKKI